MREFLKEFLKKLFADTYLIFLIGFACGIGIGFYHAAKTANKNYEKGYLEACKDFYKGKTKTIHNFIDKETVADASVDGNANVGHKDIVTLMNEMPKPHRKLLAFNKIYYELNKKYGLDLNMSETDMVNSIGYTKIWNCGLFKYVWKKEAV